MAILVGGSRVKRTRDQSNTALATNISQALQQLSYVGIVAVGSFLVAEGTLTLGALIACSILGGKSLGPIAQLPQTLTQAKQAKIALAGLEYLTSVPVDSDDGDSAQVPESIVGDLRLEEVISATSREESSCRSPTLQ